MIDQFIMDLAVMEKETPQNQIIQDTIKIFCDYCQEINNPLVVPLKYMIENNRRPRYYQNDNFYWFKGGHQSTAFDREYYHWLNRKLFIKIENKSLYKVDTYKNLLLKLKDALCS